MMPIEQKTTEQTDPSFKPLMRSLALELFIYAPLVTIYFIIVMHFAKEPLIQLYEQGSKSYAFLTLILILMQGVLLEAFTSWLLRRIGLR
jgi:hypothetical protein